MRTNRKETTPLTPLWAYGLVFALGVMMLLMVRLAQEASHWGPRVGAIVSFAPPSPGMAPDVDLTVTRLGPRGPVPCRLDSKVMAKTHGSLVIEATVPDQLHRYVVHWAGGPTSTGTDNCGTQADLVLGGESLGTLASAAGGFGTLHRSMLPVLDDVRGSRE
ncbi:MAG: hypothetical protein ACREFY_17530 [Acetobacteraceae bacterium]